SATGGGTYTVSLSGTGADPSIVPAFYVATNGNDNNSGTLTAPFATLGKAQAAMRASGTIKTTYVRAGTYSFSGSNNCSQVAVDLSSDNGETWTYYPPDGVGKAILDGGASSNATGYNAAFAWGNSNNNTINGL